MYNQMISITFFKCIFKKIRKKSTNASGHLNGEITDNFFFFFFLFFLSPKLLQMVMYSFYNQKLKAYGGYK